jgi:hypothetical protein
MNTSVQNTLAAPVLSLIGNTPLIPSTSGKKA